MSRKNLQRTGLRALLVSLLLTMVFGLGSVAGIYFYPRVADEKDLHDDEHDIDGMPESRSVVPDEDENHEEEGDHVALTEQAYANLELRMGTVPSGDYWKTLLVPARVVEIPGRSDLSVSAPVTGIVEQVDVLPGQSLVRDVPLFAIRLTDQALIDAQSKLLEAITRQEVARQEIARLSPLMKSGAVSGTKIRDLEYELKQLKAQQSTLLQELGSRGLPKSTIEKLVDSRQLASTLSIYPPSFVEDGERSQADTSGYSVENLMVHPGKSVSRGDLLCSVAYHSRLYLEGTAFQDDLAVLDQIAEQGWKVLVEQHGQSHQHDGGILLELLRVDNHVDEETQSVKFYLELPNAVTRERQADGRRFEQWRFRPGQRLHLRLPVEHWQNQLTLPVEAVVVEGPNVFVFTEHHHEEDSSGSTAGDSAMDSGEQTDHDEDDIFIELEPVPVRLLHRDDKTVVIADDGQIRRDQPVALNNAYKLYLAMKMQAGGGGHGHHHDH